MQAEAKAKIGRQKKGDRTDVRDHCEVLTLKATAKEDAELISRIYRELFFGDREAFLELLRRRQKSRDKAGKV